MLKESSRHLVLLRKKQPPLNLKSEEILNVFKCLPVLEQLDTKPIEEVKEALGSPASGKTPCQDGFRAEILKCSKEDAFKILCLCWQEIEVP